MPSPPPLSGGMYGSHHTRAHAIAQPSRSLHRQRYRHRHCSPCLLHQLQPPPLAAPAEQPGGCAGAPASQLVNCSRGRGAARCPLWGVRMLTALPGQQAELQLPPRLLTAPSGG